jgi:hypothetical protein
VFSKGTNNTLPQSKSTEQHNQIGTIYKAVKGVAPLWFSVVTDHIITTSNNTICITSTWYQKYENDKSEDSGLHV